MRYILSWVFKKCIAWRHYLYDRGVFQKKIAPLVVVSIGNLVAGGAGKTQVALLLAERLARECQVAILSRGYRGSHEKKKGSLLVQSAQCDPEISGDEPWMLATRLPQVSVIVNKDRYQGALEAKRLGAQVVILDDGMQHRKLYRDFEVIVLNGLDPFGGGHFLPRGQLREEPKRLHQADLIICIGPILLEHEEKIASMSEAPCVFAHVEIRAIRHLNGSFLETSLAGMRVGVFCGIGNPERFMHSIRSLGAEIVTTHFLADHGKMTEETLEQFATIAKRQGATLLLCTEKDKVKFKNEKCSLPIYWAEATLKMDPDQKGWEHLLKGIQLAV